MATKETDLTKQAPRSPRALLGGFAIFPRVLDKCRATIAGKQGEYNFNCPMDGYFFAFAGVDVEAFKAEVAKGTGDGDMLAWVLANSKTKPSAPAIKAWSDYMGNRSPDNPEYRNYFNGLQNAVAPKRTDIGTWAELLDVDDYATFGGKV